MKIITYIALFFISTAQATDIKKYLIDYNLKKSLAIKVKENNFKKYSVKVGILDTGYREDIKTFKNKKIASINKDIKDYGDHGDHVLGIFLSVAKDSDITLKRQTSMDSYLKGLRELVNQGVDIINISAADYTYNEAEFELLKKARDKGIIVVVAAGNEGKELNSSFKMYPASYELDNIIVVANYENKKEKAYNSNYGSKIVDIGIIGQNIMSFCQKGICRKSGTSQATPIITAIITKLKQKYPYITLKQIKHILSINSHKNDWTRYGFLDYNSLITWINNNEGV